MEGCGKLFPVQNEGKTEGERKLRDLKDLYIFAEERGIDVDRFPMARAESLSVPLPGGGYAIAIDPEKVVSMADERVKLGHELGHCERGGFYNPYATCDVRRKHENRADKWEIEQFLSEEELDEAVAEGYTQLWELAERFNVTEAFMRKAVCWYVHGNLAVEEYMNW